MARRNRGETARVDRLFRSGTAAGVADELLLERFATRHDEAAEAAFAAIVERHGPMVLGVCRRVLADPDDAADAFQATFLVLVRKAETVARRRSLGPWLYGVALRVSARSKSESARRRTVERRAGALRETAVEPPAHRGEVWDGVDRLPESLRAAVVLCYLEGLTHEQAAARLDWPVGTVRSRLARARDRLRRRFARLGLEPTTALAALPPIAASPLPTALVESTVRASMLHAVRNAFEAGLVSASVVSLTEGVIRAMITTKLRAAGAALATSLFVASAGVLAYQEGEAPKTEPAPPAKAAPSKAAPAPKVVSPRARRMAWYAEAIPNHARLAATLQAMGNLEKAAQHTEILQRLSHEWNWKVRHFDEARFPDSAYEPPDNPPSTYEFIPPRAEIRAVEYDLAFPLIREKSVEPPQPSSGTVTRPSDADVQTRIERVERKLDDVLKVLEAMNTVQGSGGRFPPKYPNPDLPAADEPRVLDPVR
jgi:RNA polymerase sigma-70 factor (ECF subfamily)